MTTHFIYGATEIPAVDKDDRSGDEVERGWAGLPVLQATVAESTEPMEGDCPGPAVARLALIQFGGNGAAQRRILEPTQSKRRALDPPDLAQCRGEAVLLAIGRQLL